MAYWLQTSCAQRPQAHLLVDIVSLTYKVHASAADVSDRAMELLRRSERRWLRRGATRPIVSAFTVGPTAVGGGGVDLAWLDRCRRLSKDYEYLTATSDGSSTARAILRGWP
jgi:hypothetical protein